MKKSLLLGALCACTFGFICQSARAQEAQNAPTVAAKSGYDLFLEANALIEDGPNGEPLATETRAPAENLRLQRLGAARNAPALAKLRAALKAYIVLPAFDDETHGGGLSHLDNTGAARNFARYLSQEAAVRAADGDALGAAQSSLDALELSSQIARGPIINALVGTAMAAIARKSLLRNAPALSAAQLREVAAQWEKISGNFPTYAQTLRDEEQLQMRLMVQNNASVVAYWSDPVAIAETEAEMKAARADGEWTEQEFKDAEAALLQVKGVTFAEVNADLRAIFDGALLRAAKPYFVAKIEAPLTANNPLTFFSAEFVSADYTRFYAPRQTVENRLLVGALRLRASKLETGQFPATFDAGIDPFSPDLAPLIYNRAGDSTILYSVGPDGIDNGGAEIQTILTDAQTGAKKVSDRLAPDSTGDIVAPVL